MQGSVLKWHNTIERWKATEDIHLGLNPNIVYLANKILFPVRRITDELNAITKRYFFLDEHGQVKYEGEQGKETPCMLPDKKIEDYDAEVKAVQTKRVEIKL